MTASGVVREWRESEGWGVIDCAATPGGCWAHASHLLVSGQHIQSVEFTFEAGVVEGCAYRAIDAWPADRPPVPRLPTTDSGAFGSTLVIDVDRDDGEQQHGGGA